MLRENWNDAGPGFHPVSSSDYLPAAQLRDLQLRRLQSMVGRAYAHVPLFRGRMDVRGLTPASIESLADLGRLPFTVKADLRDTYPFGLFASPMSVMLRTFAAAGISRGDIVQNAFGYGLFTGGLGAHYGLEAIGATVVPVSGGNTDRQVMLLRDFKVNAICATPSYFLHLIERAAELGIDLRDLPLRAGVFGAEPWTPAMRQRIEADAGIKAFDIYGLSEIIGPGVAAECSAQDGLHVFEDHFYPEVIDPETGAVLPDGQEGELVLTTLSKRAMPMIRYRTRDITRLVAEPCACGRTLRRMQRVGRRSDDMMIIHGINVFPSQIEAALLAVEGALPHYRIVLRREHGL
ncbi:phenylacetate--CoA ligase, partial [Thauera aminoaromatica]